MRQYHFFYSDESSFEKELAEFKNKIGDKQLIFQIFTEVLYNDDVHAARGVIDRLFPEAPYIGASTGGTIINCRCGKPVSVAALVFDDESTRAEVREYDISKDSLEDIADNIVRFVDGNLWIKSVELYYPVPKKSTTHFSARMSQMRPEVQITGAITCSTDITSDACELFTSCSKGKYSPTLMAVAFYGGENLNVTSICIQGWQPLGRVFKVTKAKGSIIYELDGIPACDVYKKYLNVEGDENFFYNTLEFPLYVMCNNVPVLRTPLSANSDGSITMSSDFEEGEEVRISYGDPVTIVNSIIRDSKTLDEFAPDVMHIFSCIGRKTYWSSKEPTYEIAPLEPICESSGFFSLGEYLRSDGTLAQHNVTLVIAGMREGEKKSNESRLNITEKSFSNTKMSLASRLATFIGVTSTELRSSYMRLAQAAITDGLTGLYNRKEIQSRIETRISESGKFSLIMLDIDNFKAVNDTYGHKHGDEVIVAISDILRETAQKTDNSSAGRWGGEEFMLMLDMDCAHAEHVAEKIRKRFAAKKYRDIPSQTVSIGVTEFQRGESADSICSRVDAALYAAKAEGKNRVVSV